MDYKKYLKKLLKNNKQNELLSTNKKTTSETLVDILEENINTFNFDDCEDLTYLFNIFPILEKFLVNNKNLQLALSNRFYSIHNTIKMIIQARPEPMNKEKEHRYKLLKNILNKMENSMLIIYCDSPTDYDPNKEEYISYIIFQSKNYNYFCAALNKFPYIVNSINKDEIPLVERVLESYLNALDTYLSKENLGPIDDLIYFDKVLTDILESEKININDYTRKNMLEKVKNYAKCKSFTSNRLKEKLSFFTNSIINTISGIPNDLTIDYLSYKYEIHTKFKEAHNLEAKNIYIQHSQEELPVTNNKKIYTFDGEGAKELDDGISLTYKDGIYHLGIHIADPTHYINYNSILMDEAKRRTTSRYIGDFCIPLFPSILSGDLMSLNEGHTRYAMSYYYDIDARTGELLNFTIKNEPIKIEKNLTFDYFNKCIKNGTNDIEFFHFLLNLSNIAEILKRVYDEERIYHAFHNDKEKTLSTSVIEAAMIYNNHNVAKYFDEHNLPFIYRCHKLNEKDYIFLTSLQEKLQKDENNSQMIKNIEMIKNNYPHAFYTSKNVGHFGLGTKYYSHSTSPLRRLADNVSNMCIKKFILSDYTKDDVKYMTELIDELSETINSKRASGDDYDIEYAKLELRNKSLNHNSKL